MKLNNSADTLSDWLAGSYVCSDWPVRGHVYSDWLARSHECSDWPVRSHMWSDWPPGCPGCPGRAADLRGSHRPRSPAGAGRGGTQPALSPASAGRSSAHGELRSCWGERWWASGHNKSRNNHEHLVRPQRKEKWHEKFLDWIYGHPKDFGRTLRFWGGRWEGEIAACDILKRLFS